MKEAVRILPFRVAIMVILAGFLLVGDALAA